MKNIDYKCTLTACGLILLLSLIVLVLNALFHQFSGINYFPPHFFVLVSILGLIHLGSNLLFSHQIRVKDTVSHIIYLFAAMSVIACATNAVQLTPFTPIDQTIVAFERLFQINMADIVSWTTNHPLLKELLITVYDSLPYQMCLIPLFVIIMGRFRLMNEYYFLLFFTCLLGFGFYYFFPTTAPASVTVSTLFSVNQTATALKFQQIHSYITPTTIEGGLIALPSFHCIWALLCTYLLRAWTPLLISAIVMNSLLMASCVLLGWHYPLDVVAAIGLVGFGIYCMRRCVVTN